MFDKVMVAVDGSEHALRAVDAAAVIAQGCGSELIVLTVLESSKLPQDVRQFAESEHMMEREMALANRLVGEPITSQAAMRATKNGVKNVTQLIEDGEAAKEILHVAKTMSVDLIVVGSRGLGTIRGLLLGSVSHKVMHLSECPCMTVK